MRLQPTERRSKRLKRRVATPDQLYRPHASARAGFPGFLRRHSATHDVGSDCRGPTRRIRVNLSRPGRLSAVRSSAGFQPAVSQCFQPASRTIPTVPGSTRTARRLEIGDTAGWKPALLGLARRPKSHVGTVFPLPRLRLTRMRTAGRPATIVAPLRGVRRSLLAKYSVLQPSTPAMRSEGGLRLRLRLRGRGYRYHASLSGQE